MFAVVPKELFALKYIENKSTLIASIIIFNCFLVPFSRASLQQRLALNEARRKNIDQQLLEMQENGTP